MITISSANSKIIKQRLFLRKVCGDLSANNFFMKSLWRTSGEQLHILVTLPQSHQKFATESPLAATSGKLLTQCFGELKGLPQTSPFAKGGWRVL